MCCCNCAAQLTGLGNSDFSFPTLGLIIDAFGELRDQQEQVKEDMEVKTHSHQKHFCLCATSTFSTILPASLFI